jgi:hypothetical protein
MAAILFGAAQSVPTIVDAERDIVRIQMPPMQINADTVWWASMQFRKLTANAFISFLPSEGAHGGLRSVGRAL